MIQHHPMSSRPRPAVSLARSGRQVGELHTLQGARGGGEGARSGGAHDSHRHPARGASYGGLVAPRTAAGPAGSGRSGRQRPSPLAPCQRRAARAAARAARGRALFGSDVGRVAHDVLQQPATTHPHPDRPHHRRRHHHPPARRFTHPPASRSRGDSDRDMGAGAGASEKRWGWWWGGCLRPPAGNAAARGPERCGLSGPGSEWPPTD